MARVKEFGYERISRQFYAMDSNDLKNEYLQFLKTRCEIAPNVILYDMTYWALLRIESQTRSVASTTWSTTSQANTPATIEWE